MAELIAMRSLSKHKVSRHKAQLFTLTVVLLPLSCLCPRVPEEYRPFFRLDRETQVAELRRRPIEEQLDIYIAGLTGVHPARIDLGPEIGEQGPVILPALLARMRRVSKEYLKADLIWVMRGMPCKVETADSIKIDNALDSMRLEVATMQVPHSKARAEENLRYAENRCRPAGDPTLPGPAP
jgi:hypothetical protein